MHRIGVTWGCTYNKVIMMSVVIMVVMTMVLKGDKKIK